MKTAVRNLLILLLIVGTLAVIYWLIINYYDDKNRTDDAQVDANIVPVIARTDGFVSAIGVDDDQYVTAGEVMAKLDTTDLYLQLKQAYNSLSTSRTSLSRAEVGVRMAALEEKISAQAIEAQRVSLKTSETNYERNKILKDKGIVSVQMFEFTEESFKKNTIALQSALERQTQSAEKLD
ncbi:MAG TPA: biotin/lipoyl-binding protein, partial [Puia sp.]|nr:biotin/lipoyl-binding protein [Puia sp.]